LSAFLKKEKLRGADFRHRSLEEEGVHLCEPEQGYILGDDDMGDERLTTSLMDYVEISDQHEDVMREEPIEAREPYVFKYDYLCMNGGCEREDGRLFGIVTKTAKDGHMLSEIIIEEHNQNYVMKEDEILPSHKGRKREDYTKLANQIVEKVDAYESLMRC
jgi:hypothetical protein